MNREAWEMTFRVNFNTLKKTYPENVAKIKAWELTNNIMRVTDNPPPIEKKVVKKPVKKVVKKPVKKPVAKKVTKKTVKKNASGK